MEEYDIKDEVYNDNSKIEEVVENSNVIYKSICKIIINNKGTHIGSGSLIKLLKDKKELFCLITCEHVITKEMINSNIIINVKYDYEKKEINMKLDEKERYIRYDKIVDFTVIEILPKDKINKEYFLPTNVNKINYMYKEIFIPQFPLGGKLSESKGKIIYLKNFIFKHNGSTEEGSSGSPIFLENTQKIIGIHKGGNDVYKINFGITLYSIIKLLSCEKSDNKLKERLKINDIKEIGENGYFYVGQYLNGRKEGKGIIFDKNGDIIYDGFFANDKYEGYGKLNYDNGEHYEGNFLNGLRHGKGTLLYKNGNIKYEGNFVKDKFEGYGKCIIENGEYYEGDWLNGLRHGKGTYYYNNGNIKYHGDFVNGIFEGYGLYIWENDEYYEGKFYKGERHGKGVLYDKNGNIIYEGEYNNGKRKGNV